MLLDTARPTPEPTPLPRGDRSATRAAGRDHPVPAGHPHADTAPAIRRRDERAAKANDTPRGDVADRDAAQDTKGDIATDAVDNASDATALATAHDSTADTTAEAPGNLVPDSPSVTAAPMQPVADIQPAPDATLTADIAATDGLAKVDAPATDAPTTDARTTDARTTAPQGIAASDRVTDTKAAGTIEAPQSERAADAGPDGEAKSLGKADDSDIAPIPKFAVDAGRDQDTPAGNPFDAAPDRTMPDASRAADGEAADAAPETPAVAKPPAAATAQVLPGLASETREAPKATPGRAAPEIPAAATSATPVAANTDKLSEPRGAAKPEARAVTASLPRLARVAIEPAGHAGDAAVKFSADAMQNLGLAIPGHAAAATASANPLPALTASAAVPVAGLAVAIAHEAQAGNNRFEIRLDPPELGRIDVRLDVDREGNVSSRLVVERQETLDLLRRDASQLERALQQAGLKTADNALEFSLRGQAFGRDSETPHRATHLIVAEDDAAALETPRHASGRRTGGGVDIRV